MRCPKCDAVSDKTAKTCASCGAPLGKDVEKAPEFAYDGPMVKIVDLHKSFGDNHVLRGIDFEVAKGEVVVIDENFGVRITDIASPAERAAKLQ